MQFVLECCIAIEYIQYKMVSFPQKNVQSVQVVDVSSLPEYCPFRSIAHTHTVYACSSALTPSFARSALAGPRDLQGHPDTAYHKLAAHCLKHGLAQAVGSSCLYSYPSFICTVCTVHGSFLCAFCVASEGPLWPVEHCFVLITSHDKKYYGCVQMGPEANHYQRWQELVHQYVMPACINSFGLLLKH